MHKTPSSDFTQRDVSVRNERLVFEPDSGYLSNFHERRFRRGSDPADSLVTDFLCTAVTAEFAEPRTKETGDVSV
jgi:hypothetical protein